MDANEDGLIGGPGRRGTPQAGLPAPGLVTLCAGAIVVAAIYLGRDLLVPLVLAVLLAFVLAPVVRLLRRLRLGRAPSVLIAVALAFAALGGIGLAISREAAEIVGNLPAYQAAIAAKFRALRLDELLEPAQRLMRDLGAMGRDPPAGTAVLPAPPAYAAPDPSPLELVRSLAGPVLQPLATTGVVIIFVIFVLLYREDLRDRLVRLAGSRDLHRTLAAMNDAAYRLSRYFLAQVALNASYGVLIGAGMWLLGVPSPVLWGILAGLMRFVPFVGTPIAIVPPVLLAMAVDPGWGLALSVLGLFLLTAPVMGQVLEPLLYGHSTGLSPISVIVAATFWAFLWGPVGLLLATPLTVCLVVLGRHVERLEFLEVMLGDRPPLRPEESFYQRSLEGDADGMIEQARGSLRGGGLTLSGYYDQVALRALSLAQEDWNREVLDPERLDSLRAQIRLLLEDLADEDAPMARAAEAAGHEALPAPPWREPGAVLCIAGRGPFDGLAAEMAAQVLGQHGFGARSESNTALDAAQIAQLDPARVQLCCVSVLEGGSSAASVRHFIRRLRKQLPEARLVIGLWHAGSDSPMLSALRGEGSGETILTTLREVTALAQALSQRAPDPAPAPAVPQAPLPTLQAPRSQPALPGTA